MKTKNIYRIDVPNYSKGKGIYSKSWITKNAKGEVHFNSDRAYATPVTKAEADAFFKKLNQWDWKMTKETV